jgi:hypothetical protein
MLLVDFLCLAEHRALLISDSTRRVEDVSRLSPCSELTSALTMKACRRCLASNHREVSN